MFWAMLVCAAALQQPADDASRQLEALKKKNAELQEQLTQLESSAVEDAQLIHRLRQLVKVLQEKTSALESISKASGTPAPATGDRSRTDAGPEKPLKGKVVYVDVKSGFLTLSIGKREGVKVGFKFEIYREIAEAGGELRLNRLGMAEVEKFMGQDSMAKLIVKEGSAADMKADDVAVAIRRLDPVGSAPAVAPVAPAPPAGEPKDGIFSITGNAGAAFILNYGGIHGAKQTDLVYAWSGGQLKAKLRLDKVEKNFSVANTVDGSIVTPPSVGDQVVVKEPNKVLSGKVALSDDKQGKLAVDLRQRDGVKTGLKLEARRLGQKVGTLVVIEVQTWGSWCKPDGESKIEDFRKGDFVEAIEEK